MSENRMIFSDEKTHQKDAIDAQHHTKMTLGREGVSLRGHDIEVSRNDTTNVCSGFDRSKFLTLESLRVEMNLCLAATLINRMQRFGSKSDVRFRILLGL